MPERYTPEAWNDDLTINSLTRDAELFLRKLYQKVEQDVYRFPIKPSPERPRNIWAELYYLREGVRCTDVARWLDEIQKAGLIAVKHSEQGWYLEVTERICFRRWKKGEPRYGPRDEPRPTELQLPLGPLGAVPTAPKVLPKLKATDSVSSTMTSTESNPTACVMNTGEESKNRDLSIGEGEESRFARSEEQICESKVGRRLWRFIGPKQMRSEAKQSGAQWMRLITERGDALCDLLEQGERIQSSELQTGEARAKWLTKRLKDRAA